MSWEPDITLLETLLDIRDLLQKLAEKGQKKPKVVEVDTTNGPVKVLINGVQVEEGDEIV